MIYNNDYFKAVLEGIEDGIIGVDQDGKINVLNQVAEKLLNIEREHSLGKIINEVIIDSRLLKILETGKKEIKTSFKYNGRQFIVDRIPIKVDNDVVGAVAIFHDITDYEKMSKRIDEDRDYIDILNTIIDVTNECVVVTDEKGIIIMMSKPYKEFVKEPYPEGKHVTEVIENTRLHIVLKTGEKEIGEIQQIKDNKMIAMRIPIKKNGKIIGSIGKIMFKDISDFEEISDKINNLEREIEYYKSELNKERRAKYSFRDLVGKSSEFRAVKDIAKKVAKTNSNILITGESGTGKELFAHSIHNASSRFLGAFIKINCAAIPSELLESELFGYEDGAFTGAKRGGKKGKFELANGGTILLDEIGDMSLNMQAKILRVLQEQEVERLGGCTSKKIDVRIIASTNKPLEELVKQRKFREDLYYRLNVIRINLPPLRDRKEDIEELCTALKRKISNKLGIYVEGFSNKALEYIKSYNWPGNVRELENTIERAINLLDADLIIREKHLPRRISKYNNKGIVKENKQLKDIVEEIEKEIILDCLQKTDGNKNKTAKILGISRTGLYKKMDRYNMANN